MLPLELRRGISPTTLAILSLFFSPLLTKTAHSFPYEPLPSGQNAQVCTYSNTKGNVTVGGTLYEVGNGDGALRRDDIEIIIPDSNTKVTTHILSDSHVGYIWGGVLPGKVDYKVAMIPIEKKSIAETIGPSYKCDRTLDATTLRTPDGAPVFQLPTNIDFTDDKPRGGAPNLIVLVHGCCTDENGVKEWVDFGNTIAKTIINSKPTEAWEIVVWNWSEQTPKPTISDALHWFAKADKAYFNAVDDQSGKPGQGSILAEAISAHHYDYVQLIGESSGAKLIDVAAKKLAKTRLKKQRLFIHLTFLDAYTRTAEDSGEHGYGYLEGYLKDKQYAEHYVDKSIFTDAADACLLSAFNYNISNWRHDEREGGFPPGHQWPRNWYKKSITSTSPKFKYGYTLSLAGSGKDINELVSKQAAYPVEKRCDLTYIPFINESQNCQPTACWK